MDDADATAPDTDSANPSLDELSDVATRAVRAGGDYLRGEFRNGSVDADFGTDDVKAAADRIAEARVVDVIRETFPDHAIHGEESGRRGASAFEWVVDPLDGTNNFASGFPSFATAVAVLDEGTPVVSAIYEPLPDSLYLATAGGGATVDGESIRAGSDLPLDRGTVSFVVGLGAVRDDDLAAQARAIEDALASRCKRVLQTWSPCVDWGLLARGSLEGIVCFHPDVYEQYAGSLLAAEAGVVASESEGLYVGSGDAETTATLRELVDEA